MPHLKTKNQAARLGLTVEKLNLIKKQFVSQRKSARRKGIGWELEFEEWILWWIKNLGLNWQALRGKTKDKYCMVRLNDKEAYKTDNVKCILIRESKLGNQYGFKGGISKRPGRYAYLNHKYRAKARGIEFKFSFDKWIDWWEDNLGPNWQQKRGSRPGKFVMARKGDKGPYHPDNVECILSEKNSKDTKINGRMPRGSKHHKAKLVEQQVLEIFNSSSGNKALAERFGVSITTIKSIKEGKNWGHLTCPS
jgi:hypothetical protein